MKSQKLEISLFSVPPNTFDVLEQRIALISKIQLVVY